MAKKQNRYAHLNAKRVGTTKSGCPINLASNQIDTDEELTLRLEIDGELVWKTFPRSVKVGTMPLRSPVATLSSWKP